MTRPLHLVRAGGLRHRCRGSVREAPRPAVSKLAGLGEGDDGLANDPALEHGPECLLHVLAWFRFAVRSFPGFRASGLASGFVEHGKP